ncbi:ATP-binding cassette domain-containing protein [Roseomonas gilardii]|jgi:oligopeptide/dipeptide ABC transporter ATP-binding protein|uniref:ATP-binding cassette domain-containing protein n=1 Tax=Roseomonas gilardii TaxID=257708 RepID=A0ABU3MEN1_9PROT|nr:oligopeptide/dipeptide ABC transporter ATP-binding protein [Roseomonas gilardii]MDT8331404.1 ATP-binding cassette domain-containing protein [Roseomonas gilardii]PZR14148.1 MAG: peptide ABC transporter ATP-binding protein [Azospirillum brasilense]
MPPAPLLEVRDLRKHFPVGGGLFGRGRQQLRAIDGLSFSIRPGEILSLVGESGSGKSTVGRTALRLLEPTEGSIRFKGEDITTLSRARLRPLRRQMQLVFQDPYASLNPRMTVERIVASPLEIHGIGDTQAERMEKVEEALRLVGLLPQHAQRYPHEFSGGQRQRIGLARALVTRPDFIVADEPVSALDVSIQAQVVNLMLELRDRLGLTMLVIAHDLAVVGHMSDRVAVMYLGRLVEIAETRSLFTAPRHPYTEALLSAAPDPDPTRRRKRIVLTGDVPSPLNPPSGCSFRTRCPYALPACATERPPLRQVAPGHLTACIRDDLSLQPAG